MLLRSKILTFIYTLTLGYSFLTQAEILKQEKFKTHLRWNIFITKDLISISKKKNTITIRSLNTEVFDKLSLELQSIDIHKTYIDKINIIDANKSADNISSIKIITSNDKVDLFNFYRSREKKYVLDFWIDTDDSLKPVAKIVGNSKAKKTPAVKKIIHKVENKIPLKKNVIRDKSSTQKKEVGSIQVTQDRKYRDFRYGSAFIWDYPAYSPKLDKIIDLKNKTPEHFYPIKNRKYKNSDKEAHMQISINMFNKRKFGLMYKSIKLFQKKYGELVEADLNEYLKANSILRKNFKLKDPKLTKMALNILGNIGDTTNNYEMKKGILKYLISYLVESKEYIRSLKNAKKLYVFSSESFDMEEARYGAEAILYNLSQLNQIGKIKELLKDKTLKTLLSPQVMYAYEIYTNLKIGNIKQVIKRFEDDRTILGKPIHEAILFNTAEAYFRAGEYEKALKLNDELLQFYSYLTLASKARLRIGLCYEILDRDLKETENLYLNAINRSQEPAVSLEAKLRYVALVSIRKKNPKKSEIESRIFLEGKEVERNKGNSKLMKLLWLVRLRTFIADKQFHKALSYLNVLPLNLMLASERRVFEADGSEAVYGRMIEFYKLADYSQIVRVWEVFKDKYFDKVSGDPVLNYIVGRSYIKLGLYDGFEKQYDHYKKSFGTPPKTYPNWNDRIVLVSSKSILEELVFLKNYTQKKWKTAENYLNKIEKNSPKYRKLSLYKGKLSYQAGKFKKAISYFEDYLANAQDGEISDPKEVADMLKEYTESLYELGNLERYKKVADAILKDTGKFAQDNIYMTKVRERIAYLNLEILSGEGSSAAYLTLEGKITNFLKEYKNSIYYGRVSYLLGISYFKNKRDDEGKKILNSLIVDEKISSYIKELAKSELSLLKIKERTL